MHLTPVATIYCGLRKITKLRSVESPFCNPCFVITAFGTMKSIRPANCGQIFQTSFFSAKSLFKFNNSVWIVLYANILYIVCTGVKYITQYHNSKEEHYEG